MDIARTINQQAEGPVIGAWQVDQLSEDWINAYLVVARGLPKMQAGIQLIEQKKAEIIAEHSTYRPIPKRR